MSKIPLELDKAPSDDQDKEILRVAIIAELDAVNLYGQMARLAKSEGIKEILKDIVKEEKTHIGEFQSLLLKIDPEQKQELENGAKEVEEELKK
jgi:rubrerythrin